MQLLIDYLALIIVAVFVARLVVQKISLRSQKKALASRALRLQDLRERLRLEENPDRGLLIETISQVSDELILHEIARASDKLRPQGREDTFALSDKLKKRLEDELSTTHRLSRVLVGVFESEFPSQEYRIHEVRSAAVNALRACKDDKKWPHLEGLTQLLQKMGDVLVATIPADLSTTGEEIQLSHPADQLLAIRTRAALDAGAPTVAAAVDAVLTSKDNGPLASALGKLLVDAARVVDSQDLYEIAHANPYGGCRSLITGDSAVRLKEVQKLLPSEFGLLRSFFLETLCNYEERMQDYLDALDPKTVNELITSEERSAIVDMITRINLLRSVAAQGTDDLIERLTDRAETNITLEVACRAVDQNGGILSPAGRAFRELVLQHCLGTVQDGWIEQLLTSVADPGRRFGVEGCASRWARISECGLHRFLDPEDIDAVEEVLGRGPRVDYVG